jgi:hypothetical protein
MNTYKVGDKVLVRAEIVEVDDTTIPYKVLVLTDAPKTDWARASDIAGPDVSGKVEPPLNDSWRALWDMCTARGMVADRNNDGHEDIHAFIERLHSRAEAAEAKVQKHGSLIQKAESWDAVWDLCRRLGMPNGSGRSGQDEVLAFIASNAKTDADKPEQYATPQPPEPIKPGDWVAFLRHGAIVYAKVEYVRQESGATVAGLATTCGSVSEDSVLEVRRS